MNSQELEETAVQKRGPRRRYRNHTDAQVEELIQIKTNTLRPTADIARELGIAERTAQRMIQDYNNDDEKCCPSNSTKEQESRGPKQVLYAKHVAFITSHLEDNPTTTVIDTMDILCKQFEGLKVSKSVVHWCIVNDCLFQSQKDEENYRQTK